MRNSSAVASRRSPNEPEDAASQVLERFSPEQRRELATLLEKHGDAEPGTVNADETARWRAPPGGFIGAGRPVSRALMQPPGDQR